MQKRSLLAIVALSATALGATCSPSDKQSVQDLARAVMVDSGEHVVEPTPSSLFAVGPLISAYHPNPVGHGRAAATPMGGHTYLVELRGWLRDVNEVGQAPAADSAAVGTACNSADPDWHYDLEIDPRWADSVGIDLAKLIRPGNILAFGHDSAHDFSRMISTPLVHVEGIGMDKTKMGQSEPANWQTFGRCGDAVWAYDPLHPLSWQPDLAAGQYVRIFGGLVTDGSHSGTAWFPTTMFRYTGISFTRTGNYNGTAMRWAGGRADDDPANASRWTEMHPPDIIAILADKTPEETLKGVAVSSENCFAICTESDLEADISPPGPPPSASATVGFHEIVLDSTNYRTITKGNAAKDGAEITVASDHIHIHVAVQGEAAYGVHGRFGALYRVFWQA